MEELIGKEILEKLEEKTTNHVVLKFTAEWCEPCKMMQEELDEAKLWDKYPGTEWYSVDISNEKNENEVDALGVSGVPFTVILKDGETVKYFEGYGGRTVKKIDWVLSGKCPECGHGIADELSEKELLLRYLRSEISEMKEYNYSTWIKLPGEEEEKYFDCDIDIAGAYLDNDGYHIMVRVPRAGWDDVFDNDPYDIIEDHVYEMLSEMMPELDNEDVEMKTWVLHINGDIVV